MIPYGHQCIDQQDINKVKKVLNSDWITQGPSVKAFEEQLAKYAGAKYAVVTSHGTDALFLAYLAAGIKKGDEVITTPNTFVATTNMLLALGAKPVFCDIRLDTYNIDETKIEKLISKKTKAIVPVHFAGHPCEMNKIKRLAKKHKLLVIEDACHALGAKYGKKRIGNIGDLSVFSFHPVKSIATGEGGAVLTNNKQFYQKMNLMRSHGITKDAKGFNVMTEFGYNFRLTDIQAALGLSQLKKLDSFVKKRLQVVKQYKNLLKDVEGIELPTELKDICSAWHLYIIRTKKKSDRLKLYNYLLKNGIGVNFHYPAVYSHPYYRKNGYKKVKCANAEIYHHTAITIPLFPALKTNDINYIAKIIKSFFN